MLVPKIKPLDGLQGLTNFLLSSSKVFIPIDEPLVGIQVPLVLREACSRVTSFFIQWRHWDPFIIKNIKFLAVFDHFIILVAPSDHVDIPVFELIMGSERSPPLRNRLQILNLVGQQMELKNISHWLDAIGLIVLIYVTWNDNNSVIWNIDSPAIFQRLIQFVGILVIDVLRRSEAPFHVWLRSALAVS